MSRCGTLISSSSATTTTPPPSYLTIKAAVITQRRDPPLLRLTNRGIIHTPTNTLFTGTSTHRRLGKPPCEPIPLSLITQEDEPVSRCRSIGDGLKLLCLRLQQLSYYYRLLPQLGDIDIYELLVEVTQSVRRLTSTLPEMARLRRLSIILSKKKSICPETNTSLLHSCLPSIKRLHIEETRSGVLEVDDGLFRFLWVGGTDIVRNRHCYFVNPISKIKGLSEYEILILDTKCNKEATARMTLHFCS